MSLINCDERLLSQAHNKRLAPVLEQVVHSTQTGFIPKRQIDTNIRWMQGVISGNPNGYMAVMDFEKAYDRLSHDFVSRALLAYGIGPKFATWLKATYKNASAHVLINGWFSAPVPLLSGVRQGDPLAPSIFALCIEFLAKRIRAAMTGAKDEHGFLHRERLFADDVVCFVHNLDSLKRLNRAIGFYERASASRLSTTKFFIYRMGAN